MSASDSEYLVSLIADCHKSKYHIVLPLNAAAALGELMQAVKTIKEHHP